MPTNQDYQSIARRLTLTPHDPNSIKEQSDWNAANPSMPLGITSESVQAPSAPASSLSVQQPGDEKLNLPAPSAPAPSAPSPSPTPQGAASPMASLQAAADPGAGWAQSATQNTQRPGLGARSMSPMQRLFSGLAY